MAFERDYLARLFWGEIWGRRNAHFVGPSKGFASGASSSAASRLPALPAKSGQQTPGTLSSKPQVPGAR